MNPKLQPESVATHSAGSMVRQRASCVFDLVRLDAASPELARGKFLPFPAPAAPKTTLPRRSPV
jgi:hypothetical protein